MKVFKPYVASVDVRSTELTKFSDVHKSFLITCINLNCIGELKDGTSAEFTVEVTQQERGAIIKVFENIMERFRLENDDVSECDFRKKDTLAGIGYEDG